MGDDSLLDTVLDMVDETGLLRQDGYKLDRQEIEEAEDLDDLLWTYRNLGYDIEDVEEAYEQAKDDWYSQVRDHNIRQHEQLPGTTIRLVQDEDEQRVHVHGIAHGGRKIHQLDDTVRHHIQEGVEDYMTEGSQVLLEENLDEVVFDEMPDDAAVVEMDDHDVMQRHSLSFFGDLLPEREDTERPDPREEEQGEELQKLEAYMEKYVKVMDTLQPSRETDVARTTLEALDDPEMIADVQNVSEAAELPYHLEADFNQYRTEKSKEEAQEAREELFELYQDDANLLDLASKGFEGYVLPELEQAWYEMDGLIKWERSEYMAEEALEALDDETEDVHLVVGAGHQHQITRYIEEMDGEELEQYLM
ncbi:MAG: hypothetical protein SVU32_03305, partial [Candidatus Nanohaloarchaea archaeon]|nr:hypothetical protein [Candidatus Nanohaloarchaea archaeon]